MPGPPQPRWRNVLFDLDGTLVDTIPLIVASYQHALSSVLGRTEDERVIRSWIGRSLRAAFVEVSPEHADELHDTYLAWNLAHTAEMIRTLDGIPELVADLVSAGAQVGIVTSKRRETAHLALSLAGLADGIPLLATLTDTEEHKPNPTPLLFGLSRLGPEASPTTAVYVGDALVDIVAARAAGMGAVAVRWGAGDPEALATSGADAVCDAVPELREALLPAPEPGTRTADLGG